MSEKKIRSFIRHIDGKPGDQERWNHIRLMKIKDMAKDPGEGV